MRRAAHGAAARRIFIERETMKLQMLLTFLIPLLDSCAALLAAQDTNTSVADDRAAQVLRAAAASLREFTEEKK